MTIIEQQKTIQHLLDSGRSFALYRLPGATHIELVLQDAKTAQPIHLGDTNTGGFIFAPFTETSKRPTILIKSDRTANGWEDITRITQTLLPTSNQKSLPKLFNKHAHKEAATKSNDYKAAFERLHRKIVDGHFKKLVLSYSQENKDKHLFGNEAAVFLKALKAYPNAMVYLVNATHCGRWMGCTPELLLQKKGNQYHTVALAGTTVNKIAEWDSKNIYEQDVVSQYITKTLQTIGASNIERSNCDTMQIGKLSHRRTQFNFTFKVEKDTLDIVRALHPTPAVCGLPKEEAKAFLIRNEHTDRNYFSGYLGRIHSNGDAHLFVNLRCAQITNDTTFYHAGGGLTAASTLQDEAKEIELKMDTLQSLL